MAASLEFIKLTLGLNTDTSDKLLNMLVERATNRFKILLPRVTNPNTGAKELQEVSEALDWIIEELVIERFNRIGSEGVTSETVAGHSVNFSEKDFKSYWDYIIMEYPELDENADKKGSIKFYI